MGMSSALTSGLGGLGVGASTAGQLGPLLSSGLLGMGGAAMMGQSPLMGLALGGGLSALLNGIPGMDGGGLSSLLGGGSGAGGTATPNLMSQIMGNASRGAMAQPAMTAPLDPSQLIAGAMPAVQPQSTLGSAVSNAAGNAAIADNPPMSGAVDPSQMIAGVSALPSVQPSGGGGGGLFGGSSGGGALGGMSGLAPILGALAVMSSMQPMKSPNLQPPGWNTPPQTSGYLSRSPTTPSGNFWAYGKPPGSFFSGNGLHFARGGNVAPQSRGALQQRPQFDSGAGDSYVKTGLGDGQQDKTPALLSDGEYVLSASDVSRIGQGDSDAGAKRLDEMRKKIAADAGTKHLIQNKVKHPLQYMRGGLT